MQIKLYNISHLLTAETLMNSFSANIVNEWNKLDAKITNRTSQFLIDFIEFYSTVHCDTFEIHNPA